MNFFLTAELRKNHRFHLDFNKIRVDENRKDELFRGVLAIASQPCTQGFLGSIPGGNFGFSDQISHKAF